MNDRAKLRYAYAYIKRTIACMMREGELRISRERSPHRQNTSAIIHQVHNGNRKTFTYR